MSEPDHKIPGGFYLKARKSQMGWIATAPPHVREIWDFILLEANWKDHGHIKRGQLLTSYRKIQEGLAWYVGYRKHTYKKHHCDTAARLLTKQQMITITRTTRGIVITVCNYEYYQNPQNYETDSVDDNKQTMNGHEMLHDKERRNKGIKEKEKHIQACRPEWFPENLWVSFIENRKFKKLSNSSIALTTICNKFQEGVEAGYQLEACVNEYIASRWTRFSHTWMSNGSRPETARTCQDCQYFTNPASRCDKTNVCKNFREKNR